MPRNGPLTVFCGSKFLRSKSYKIVTEIIRSISNFHKSGKGAAIKYDTNLELSQIFFQ